MDFSFLLNERGRQYELLIETEDPESGLQWAMSAFHTNNKVKSIAAVNHVVSYFLQPLAHLSQPTILKVD